MTEIDTPVIHTCRHDLTGRTPVIGVHGPHGHAVALDVTNPEVVCWWLLDVPNVHPWWCQYALLVESITDQPGMIDVPRDEPGSTHRLIVMALNPDFTYSLANLRGGDRVIRWLLPFNHVIEFQATDAEMRSLVTALLHGIVTGELTPETADDPDRLREVFRGSADMTLAHIRGYHHQEVT